MAPHWVHCILLLIILTVTDGAVTVIESPGVLRHYAGDDASMTWRYSGTYTSLGNTFSYKGVDFYILSPSDTVDYIDPAYVGRVTSSRTSTSVTLNLLNVGTFDAQHGNYSNIQIIQGQSPATNSNAALFIYAKPTKASLPSNPINVEEKQDADMTCTSASNSIPVIYQQPLTFTWYLGGQNITSSPPPRHEINNNILTIRQVQGSDSSNRYTCQATEPGGLSSDVSNQAQLNVRYKPGSAVLEGAPPAAVIEAVGSLTLTCSVTDSGNPAPTYNWDNIDSTFSISTGNSNQLIVTSTQLTARDHDGRWQCWASNNVGIGLKSPNVQITINARTTLHGNDLPPERSVVITDTLSISCSFKAKPQATVTWVYTGDAGSWPDGVTTNPTYSTVDRVNTVTTSTLTWAADSTDAQKRASSGTYRCKASNNVGGEVSSGSMVLDVQYGPYEISLTPQGPVTYNETAEVRVTCSSDCNPLCDFLWTRDNDGTFEDTNPVLIIDSVSRQDDNLYSCQASKHGVQRSVNIDITVNFAAEVADFIHSGTGSDIQQEAEITLTCTVNSRPGSIMELIDTEHGVDLPSCVQCLSLGHTFSSIQVTDSSNYTCTAANILGPDPKARKPLEIDVKGPYETCNSPPTAVGRPLNSNITMDICLTANPIEAISESDWSFVPDNDTKMDNNLPEGVKVVTESTNHQYKKLTKLVIDNILLLHYGRYSLSKANNYGGQQVSFSLVPEGPPEVPYDFEVTRVTALNIHLRWKAGFDGGRDQKFQLEVTAPQGIFNKDIPGTGYKKDDTVVFSLLESDGLIPETSYSVTLIATNSKGSVTGETLSTSTKARPVFTEDKPTIELQTDHALVTWSVSNLDSMTHILAEVCVSADCQTTNITDPAVQPYTVLLPQTTGKQYSFAFTFYDGEDIVNQEETIHKITGLNLPAVIGGVVGGVLLAAVVIVVVVVLWKKGIIGGQEKQAAPNARDRLVAEVGSDEPKGLGNPASSATSVYSLAEDIQPYSTARDPRNINGAVNTNEINPYGTSNDFQVSTSQIEIQGVAAAPPNGVTYAQVNKPGKPAIPGGKPKPPNKPENGSTARNSARPVSQYPPALSKTKPPENQPPVYAQVNKPKKEDPSNKAATVGDKSDSQASTSTSNASPPVYAQVQKKSKPEAPPRADAIPNPTETADKTGKDKGKKRFQLPFMKAKDKKAAAAPAIGQAYENVEMKDTAKSGAGVNKTAPKGGEKPYVNVMEAGGPEGAYSEVRVPGLGPDAGGVEYQNFAGPGGDNPYANVDAHGNRPVKQFQRVGVDGTLYAELEHMRAEQAAQAQQQPVVIHGAENKTEYASIDYNKLKKRKT